MKTKEQKRIEAHDRKVEREALLQRLGMVGNHHIKLQILRELAAKQ